MEAAPKPQGYAEERVETRNELRMVGHELACLPKEEAMYTPNRPLPLALRHEELTEQQFEAMYQNAIDPNAAKGRLTRKPRSIPTVERGVVATS